jgi:flagellar biosynthesis GTPase FlhF
VIVLSLEPVRRALELVRQTEALDVELITVDHPGLIDFALRHIGGAETVIVDTPGIAPGDEAGWARLAMLLGPIAPHESHLLVPGTLDAAGIDASLGSASEKLQIDRLILTNLDEAPGLEAGSGPGPAVSAAIRAGIPISATASATLLVPAYPYRLATRILP